MNVKENDVGLAGLFWMTGCVLALGIILGWTIIGYLDRPVVEISIITDLCVRAYGPEGPIPCEVAMKGSYEPVYVPPANGKK